METTLQYPKVVPATEWVKRLNISYNSALLLKRRLQLLASDSLTILREVLYNTLQTEFKGYQLPLHQGNGKSSADSVVLYSASQRANKGRKRRKHSGQTASIYLSDSLGGKQIGTLVHTIAFQNGAVFYDAIQDQTADTLLPLIKATVPKECPIYTDEAYSFLNRIYPNYRAVNHSKKGKYSRFAKDRWSQDGVHNQLAEGRNSVLKTAFRIYRYISPEYAPLYLNEFSFFANLKALGWDILTKPQSSALGFVSEVGRQSLTGYFVN
ncbi:MAG: transposase [Leptospiraceae bacterium]|nr:transposase [Leptospiraceae bacterium]MCP5500422.1 transposase [Leptospiraceae bacterium]